MRGPAARLSQSNLTGLSIVLDLADSNTPGERTLSVLPSHISLPAGVEFIRSVPAQVRLKLEARMSRDVSVVPRYFKMPEAWEIEHQEAFPPQCVSSVRKVTSVESSGYKPIRSSSNPERTRWHTACTHTQATPTSAWSGLIKYSPLRFGCVLPDR